MYQQPMTGHSQGKYLLTAGLAIFLAVVGFYVLTAPDQRGAGQKLSDAAKDEGDGIKKATNQQ